MKCRSQASYTLKSQISFKCKQLRLSLNHEILGFFFLKLGQFSSIIILLLAHVKDACTAYHWKQLSIYILKHGAHTSFYSRTKIIFIVKK